MTSKSNTYDYVVFSRAVHITYLNSSCTSGEVRVTSLGGAKKGVAMEMWERNGVVRTREPKRNEG